MNYQTSFAEKTQNNGHFLKREGNRGYRVRGRGKDSRDGYRARVRGVINSRVGYSVKERGTGSGGGGGGGEAVQGKGCRIRRGT